MAITIPKQTFGVSLAVSASLDAGVPIPMQSFAVGMSAEAAPVSLGADIGIPMQSIGVDATVHPCLALSVVVPPSLIPQIGITIKPRARAKAAHRQSYWLVAEAGAAHLGHYRLGREAIAHADRWRVQCAARRQCLDAWQIGDWAKAAHRSRAPLRVEARHAAYSRHVVAGASSSGLYGWRIEAAFDARHTLIADTRAAHAAGYALRRLQVAGGHSAAWASSVATSHSAAYGLPVDLVAAHSALLADATAARAAHVAGIDDAPRVVADHVVIDSAVVATAAAHSAPVTESTTAAAAHSAGYGAVALAWKDHSARYAPTGGARRAHALLGAAMPIVVAGHVARSRIATTAARGHGAAFALAGADVAAAAQVSRYTISNAAVWQADGRASLTVAGRSAGCVSASVSADWGAGVWVASLEVDPADLAGVPLLESAVVLSLFGRQWSMIVTETALAEKIEGVALSITATSPLARIASPPAATSTEWSTTPLAMSAWCARLAGQGVDWHLPDDLVVWPDARGEDAFEAIKKVAATPGGVLYSAPGGELSAHPWRGSGRGTAALAADEIIDLSVRRIKRTPVGFVTVGNTPADAIEYDAETRIARVIASRLRPLELDHTAPAGTALVALGTEDAAVSERVEVKAGRAAVAHPIVSLGSVVWHGRPLAGSPVWRPGFGDIAWAAGGYGVATINYTRREQKWRLNTNKSIVQLLVREEETHERYHDYAGS